MTGQIFFKTLCLFSNIGIYANAVYDSTSPYATSAIELEDPFLEYQQNGLQMYAATGPGSPLVVHCVDNLS